MSNFVHIKDLNVKIVDVWPHGLVDIGQLPLVHADDDSYLETSSSGKAFLIDDQNSFKDRAEWIPLSKVTLLRCTGKAFDGVFTTLIPFWLAKEKKLIK